MGKETLTDTFCRLQKKLHLVAGRLLNDETEAEDAVQDAFCRLWSAEPPGSTDEARYRMFAVLRNVCLNKLGRRRGGWPWSRTTASIPKACARSC